MPHAKTRKQMSILFQINWCGILYSLIAMDHPCSKKKKQTKFSVSYIKSEAMGGPFYTAVVAPIALYKEV